MKSFILQITEPANPRIKYENPRRQCLWTRVSNDAVWMEGCVPSVLRLMAVSSMIFGGLHCIAWPFEFPSRTELFCWRAASLTSAVLPMIVLAVSSFMNYLATTHAEREYSSTIIAYLQGLEQFPDLWWKVFFRNLWHYTGTLNRSAHFFHCPLKPETGINPPLV